MLSDLVRGLRRRPRCHSRRQHRRRIRGVRGRPRLCARHRRAKGVANPLALLMSAVMMLNHIADTRGRRAAARSPPRFARPTTKRFRNGRKRPATSAGSSTPRLCASAVIDRLGRLSLAPCTPPLPPATRRSGGSTIERRHEAAADRDRDQLAEAPDGNERAEEQHPESPPST